jgi:ribosomal protein L11 methyltransferase
VDRGAADAAGECLYGLGAHGLEIREGGRDGPVELIAHLRPAPRTGSVIRAIRRRLRAIAATGARVGRARVEARRVADPGWALQWRHRFRVTRIGRAMWVHPAWDPPPRGARGIRIRLDPGMGFGTGAHPTTRLCLGALEALGRRKARVLDLGTGSGILAIAAARLGARRVVAVDPDPVACAEARRNAAANRVASRVRVRLGTLARAGRGRFDAIVANLEAKLLGPLVPALAGRLAPGGALVLSGLLRREGPPLRAAMRRAGLRLGRTRATAGWIALRGERP